MSFTFTNGCHTARVDGQHAYIPAVGWVRMREALHFTGDILSATVSLTAGRRFIAFQVQTADRKPALRPGPVMGIDMGIKTLATLWDGDEVTETANPRPLQAALAELRRVHQALARSRKVHGRHNHSHRREALYAGRQRLYAQVSHMRSDHRHKVATALARRGGTVKVETLNISGMAQNSRLARSVHDAGLGACLRMPAYKCAWHGTAFVPMDRWYPSLKTCSRCGAGKQALLLSERTCRCVACGFECDRDANAARNLQAYHNHTAARSAVADAETRRTDRIPGPHGRRSVNQTESSLPLCTGVGIFTGSGDRSDPCGRKQAGLPSVGAEDRRSRWVGRPAMSEGEEEGDCSYGLSVSIPPLLQLLREERARLRTGPSTGHGEDDTMAGKPHSTEPHFRTVTRTLRVRLYPGTAANGQYLEQLAGACRFAWNHVLAGHERDYRMWKAFGKL
ncbi:MAG: RNA-guided endonuclease TnpB family protein, partial [Caldilineaceae bacterium]|nr:RNA-guided endonuclease TnpB family protein [Caldilineaceae bacterium]